MKGADLVRQAAASATPFAARSIAPSVDAAMLSRRSVRAFDPDPVSRETIEEILALASRAPSGSNIQPWQVIALTGAPLTALTAVLHDQVMSHGVDSIAREYNYYPVKWREPYIGRRRRVGWDLYSLLNITRDDKARMTEQHARNYLFFDAPAALIFTIDRDMEQGSWLDYGMLLQSVMLAARGRGLDTCPEAAIAQSHEIVQRELKIPADRQVVCGMALGFGRTATVNTLITEREPVNGFTRFEGF